MFIHHAIVESFNKSFLSWGSSGSLRISSPLQLRFATYTGVRAVCICASGKRIHLDRTPELYLFSTSQLLICSGSTCSTCSQDRMRANARETVGQLYISWRFPLKCSDCSCFSGTSLGYILYSLGPVAYETWWQAISPSDGSTDQPRDPRLGGVAWIDMFDQPTEVEEPDCSTIPVCHLTSQLETG